MNSNCYLSNIDRNIKTEQCDELYASFNRIDSPLMDLNYFDNDGEEEDYDELDNEQTRLVHRNRGGRKQVKQGTTKRNARERNRVRFINNCFEILREHIPFELVDEKKNRKLSKVETLKYATEYIKQLGDLLSEFDASADRFVHDEHPSTKRLKSDHTNEHDININIYDNRIGSGSYGQSSEYLYSPTSSTSSCLSSSSASSSSSSCSSSCIKDSPRLDYYDYNHTQHQGYYYSNTTTTTTSATAKDSFGESKFCFNSHGYPYAMDTGYVHYNQYVN